MEVCAFHYNFVQLILWFKLFLLLNDRGAGPGCNTQEIGEKLARLRSEVAALESLESNLDQHKQVRLFPVFIFWYLLLLNESV